MSYYNERSDITNYYKAPSNILAWQGICPTDKKNKFLIVGTQSGGFGAIYKGNIDVLNTNKILEVKFPNSISTSVYGPDYKLDKRKKTKRDIIIIVGSYQTEKTGAQYPCKGFGYIGKYGDFSNTNNYFKIEPLKSYNFTVVHSTRGGLAVYVSSNESQVNLILGKSFIFDIERKKTITEVIYPDSSYTTTYGIWYNARKNNYKYYTISGGFSLTGLLDTRTFVVDFIYDTITEQGYFKNWTEIKIPGVSIYTHAQGITGLDSSNYILPVANYYIDPENNKKLTEISGGKIYIKRKDNNFILRNYESINFPQSKISIVTSAAEESVVGVFINNNKQGSAFQANKVL